MFDPRISRNRKNIAEICPELLDLYASIYGSMSSLFGFRLLRPKAGFIKVLTFNHYIFSIFRFNSTKGWLADATGNYTVDTKCTWLIEAPSPTDRIRIHLKEFATECGWDHLYVFDGDSVRNSVKSVCHQRFCV